MATLTLDNPPLDQAAQAQHVHCAHCDLPVPVGARTHGASEQFCCEGCRAAYAVIQGCGLSRYYQLRDAALSPAPRSEERTPARGYADLDDATFARLYVTTTPDGLARTELLLQGVHCPACVWLVERLPSVVAGVVSSTLDLRRACVTVVWNPHATPLSRIAQALHTLGYPPHPLRGVKARALRRLEDRAAMVRLAVAGACASNVMLLFFAMYAGLFSSIDAPTLRLLRWVSMGLSVVAMLWPGSVIFRSAWAALRTRTMHLDIPIALGLGLGLLWGVVNTIRDTGEIYFDSLAALVFFLLVARFIQQRQQRWASDAVELLHAITPSVATLCDDGTTREVPVESLRVGDLVAVRAGETMPVDGTIVEGVSTLDRALLTGESTPSDVRVGDVAHAGETNLSGELRVRVEKAGEETRVAAMMRLVEVASREKAPIVHLADRLAAHFTIAITALALFTAVFWWPLGPAKAIEHAIALLVITCPCGLGLATPLTMTIALGRAARRGMLVKSGAALERLAKPGTLVLDKTGTLTLGRSEVMRWSGDEGSLRYGAALARGSSHHAARAVARAWADAPIAEQIREVLGQGLEGVVEGHRVRLGSPSFVAGETPLWDAALAASLAAYSREGLTPMLVAIDGVVRAALGLGDAPRDDASQAVRALREGGWRVLIASGDGPLVVRAVASGMGIDDARGGLLPEQKLALVRELHAAGQKVVMVGDGVNDAPALAAADVGIAVQGGADASKAAGDVVLGSPGIGPIVALVRGARGTMRTIHAIIVLATLYNCVAAGLCMLGMITPLLAAIIMPASSLTALVLALRSRVFRESARENRGGAR